MSPFKLARTVFPVLVACSLFPLARSAPPIQTGPVCNGTLAVVEQFDCPGYAVIYTGIPESLGGCSGCKVSWTATVIELSSGDPVGHSSGADEASCSGASMVHSVRCPGGGLLETFSLVCNTCQ